MRSGHRVPRDREASEESVGFPVATSHGSCLLISKDLKREFGNFSKLVNAMPADGFLKRLILLYLSISISLSLMARLFCAHGGSYRGGLVQVVKSMCLGPHKSSSPVLTTNSVTVMWIWGRGAGTESIYLPEVRKCHILPCRGSQPISSCPAANARCFPGDTWLWVPNNHWNPLHTFMCQALFQELLMSLVR